MADNVEHWVTDEIGDPTSFYLGLMKERTPEMANSLQDAVDQFGIHFEIDADAERCRFSSHSATGKIAVGLKGAARLMGHTFSYTCGHYGLLKRLQSLIHGGPEKLIDEQATRSASQLLAWAVTGDIQSKAGPLAQSFIPNYIPDDLAQLITKCLPANQQEIAAEVYGNALVWILYHEVSHIQMGHLACTGLESLEQEREADRMASEWMLGSEDINPIDLCKRQWGIATALGWLTAPTAFLGPGSMTTHPAAYDRLYQTLDRFISEEHEDVWLFVQIMLILHILLAGLVFNEERIGPPLKENASLLINVIAAVGRK
jgi:Peptidase U49